MSQPADAPPEEWRPRTDAGARKLIERIDRLEAKLEGLVTHKHLLIWAATTALVIVGGAWTVTNAAAQSAKDDVRQLAAAPMARVAEVETSFKEHIRASDAKHEEHRRDNLGIYKYLTTRQRTPRLDKAAAELAE
jgi:hypothetical protein